MEILYARCAGFDVHKKTVRVCLLIQDENGQSHKEFRTYGTTTEELLKLVDWLKEQGCTHVAMEGTSVFWRPLYNLIEGEDDPQALTDLALGKLRTKLPQQQKALEGRVESHHRLLLKEIIAHIDFLEQQIFHLLEEIEARMNPYKEVLDLLMSIPGIQLLTALTILSEVGIDLSAFPSDKHFAP